MSAYFQRLLRQSGVQLSAPAASAVSVSPTPSVGRAAAEVPLANDLVEVHEQRTTFPASPALPSPSAVQAVPFTSRPSSLDPAQAASPAVPALSGPFEQNREQTVIQKIDTVESETVSLGPVRPALRSSPVSPASPPTSDRKSQETTSTPAAASPTPELPAEIMEAVMKWIAAGSAPATPSAAGVSEVSERMEKASAPSPAVPAAPLSPRETPKIPERVIQIVEEHFEEAAPPPRPYVAASAGSAQPPPAFVSPPESPVRVSIGSIQVRVDAPVAPPSRVVRPTAPARAAAPAPRSSGISQLRRHYIIPH